MNLFIGLVNIAIENDNNRGNISGGKLHLLFLILDYE